MAKLFTFENGFGLEEGKHYTHNDYDNGILYINCIGRENILAEYIPNEIDEDTIDKFDYELIIKKDQKPFKWKNSSL